MLPQELQVSEVVQVLLLHQRLLHGRLEDGLDALILEDELLVVVVLVGDVGERWTLLDLVAMVEEFCSDYA